MKRLALALTLLAGPSVAEMPKFEQPIPEPSKGLPPGENYEALQTIVIQREGKPPFVVSVIPPADPCPKGQIESMTYSSPTAKFRVCIGDAK